MSFDYAVDLYRRGDYFRSISEFDRWLYFDADSRGSTARRYVASAYFLGERWEASARAWGAMLETGEATQRRQASFFLAESLYEMGRLDEAMLLYGDLEGTVGAFEAPSRLRMLSINAVRHEWSAVRTGLERGLAQAEDPVEKRRWERRRSDLDRTLEAWVPSPGLALTASAVVPGAGQAWAGFPRDGLSALGLVAGFAFWAWVSQHNGQDALAGGFTGLAGLFYLGNLQGAWNASQRAGRERSRNAAQALIDELPLDDMPEPKP